MDSLKLFSLLLTLFVFSGVIECHLNDPDYAAPLEKIIETRGFNYEKHFIETKDGYILGVYRLVNPFIDQSLRSKLKPIVLQHGFLGTGADFLINSPGGHAVPCNISTDNYSLKELNSTENNNLGFFLANLCYDVWISNSRGNGYSRNHTTLNPDKDSEFWKYTIDELIAYDTPAVIDYVLKETEFSSLGWIGHSQGTTIMFGLLSERPEYSSKVKPFIALAPVFYVKNMKRVFQIAAKIPGLLFLARTRGGEISKSSLVTNTIKKLACSTWNEEMCNLLLYPFLGYDMDDVNATRVEIYSTKIGSGSSLWNAVHFGQNINSGKFYKFDFGGWENKRRYGQAKPPTYELSKINSTSIALLYAKGDALSDYKDVSQLIKDIQVPLVRDYCVPLPSWNHYDFIFAKESYKYINSIVAQILSTF